jgi:ribonuclease E
MTRKRVGEGLLEAFSEPCEHCHGRGVIIHAEPINQSLGDDSGQQSDADAPVRAGRRGRGRSSEVSTGAPVPPVDVYDPQAHRAAAAAMNAIARRAQSEVPPSEPTNDDAGAPSGSNSYAAIDADPDADAPAEAPTQEDSGVDPDEPAAADAARSDAGEGAELSQPEIAPSGPSAGAAATPPEAPVAEPAALSNGARPRRRRAAGPPRTADVPG